MKNNIFIYVQKKLKNEKINKSLFKIICDWGGA